MQLTVCDEELRSCRDHTRSDINDIPLGQQTFILRANCVTIVELRNGASQKHVPLVSGPEFAMLKTPASECANVKASSLTKRDGAPTNVNGHACAWNNSRRNMVSNKVQV